MHCRNVHNARASNVFIPRSVCGEFAAGVVGAAVEGTVGAVAEDEGAAATGAFAGGDGGVAPLFVGADIAYVFFA